MNKKVKIIIAVVVCLLFALSWCIVLSVNKNAKENPSDNAKIEKPIINKEEEKNNDVIEEPNSGDVLDHNRFFTIENCISNLVSKVNSNEMQYVSYLLNDDYKNTANVNNEINQMTSYYLFEATKITYENLKENIVKYYVDGYLIRDVYEANSDTIPVKYTVFFDQENRTYSIALKEQFDSNIATIMENGYNTYNVLSMTDQEIAKKYYYNLRKMVYLDDKNLSNIIRSGSITTEDFANTSIKTYKITDKSNKYIVYIVNTNGATFTFKVSSVLNYTVSISK